MNHDDPKDPLEDPRFQAVLASCYEALEAGQPLDRDELLSKYPEFADALQSFLDDEQFLRTIAADLRRRGASGEAHDAVGDATIDAGARGTEIVAGEKIRYLGEYELLKEIARGGMGVVFQARQRNLRRIVALKMIRAGQLATAEDVQRFRREAQAAGRLSHPNIVAIHEVGQHEGHHYFTMDYVEGQSLAEAIRETPLPTRRAAELVRLVAEAVQFAHDRGTVHRDLKPANILLDANGSPKITDFGLAKMVVPPEDRSQVELTATGQILGTPAYMSPEQASSKQHPVGPATDIYSLGAVLYATLTGRPPFAAETPVETLLQVVHREPLALRSLNPGIPRDLETICMKCLAKQPRARYATARELADDLQRWLDGRPIQARPIGPVTRAWKWSRRHPAWTTLLLILLVSTVAVTWLWHRARIAYDAAAEQLYVHRVALAEREWLVQNRSRAMELLLDCDPQQQGWEWQFVARLCFATPHVDLTVSPRLMGMVQFDPTGQFLAAADQEVLRIWDSRRLRLLSEIEGTFFRFTFSPDGQQIAAGIGSEVQCYSVPSGEPRERMYAGDAKVYSVSFDSRGEHLAVLDETLTVVLIRVEDREVISRFPVRENGSAWWGVWLRFLPNSPQIVVAASDGAAGLWDSFRGEKIRDFAASETSGRPCALSDDGTHIVYKIDSIQLNHHPIEVHDVSAKRVYTIAFDSPPYAAAISPDNRMLVVALEELNMDVEDIRGAENDLTGFLGALVILRGKPQPKRAMIYLYDLETGKRLRQLRGHAGSVFFDSLAISPDGKRLASAGGFRRTVGEDDFVGELKIWDLQDTSPALVLRGHDAAVKHVAISSDSRWIASGDEQGTVCVWRANGPLEQVFRTRSGEVRGLAFADNDRQIAIADREAIVWWNIDQGTQEHSLGSGDRQGHVLEILAFCGEATGQHTAYCTRQAVHILDPAANETVVAVPERPSALSIDAGRRQFALTYFHDMHGELRTFAWETGRPGIHVQTEPVGNPFRTGWGLLDAAFSPDGRRVAGVGNNGPGLVWDTRTGRQVLELVGHSSFIWAVAYSHDGTRIATGSWDTTIKLWDAATGREMMTLRGHESPIYDLAFSPCDGYLVSCSADHTVRIWNASTKEFSER